MKVGEKLKRLRIERKITQKTLAESLGVSRITLSKWENGRGNPPVKVLLEYQKLFNLEGSFFDKKSDESVTFDVSRLNLSGRLELREFYNSLIKNKEYLKKQKDREERGYD